MNHRVVSNMNPSTTGNDRFVRGISRPKNHPTIIPSFLTPWLTTHGSFGKGLTGGGAYSSVELYDHDPCLQSINMRTYLIFFVVFYDLLCDNDSSSCSMICDSQVLQSEECPVELVECSKSPEVGIPSQLQKPILRIELSLGNWRENIMYNEKNRANSKQLASLKSSKSSSHYKS